MDELASGILIALELGRRKGEKNKEAKLATMLEGAKEKALKLKLWFMLLGLFDIIIIGIYCICTPEFVK